MRHATFRPMRGHVACCLLAATLLTPHGVLAQSGVSETRADAPDSGAQGTTSRIDPSEAVPSMTSLADVLDAAPSTDIRRSGGWGSPAWATIRGAEPWHVRVLLDGVPLHGAQDTAFDLSTIPAELLGSITVHRSLVPVQLGAPSPGGVVQLETRFDDEGVLAWAGGGSFAARRVGLAVQLREDDSALLLSGQYAGAGNTYPYFDDRGTPLNQADDREAQRANAHVDAGTLLARHRTQLGRWRLTSVALANADAQGVPGLGSDPALGTGLSRHRVFGAFRAQRRGWPGRNADLTLVAGGSVSGQRYRDPDDELGLGAQDERSRGVLLLVGAHPTVYPTAWLTLRGVLDLEHERYTPVGDDGQAAAEASRTTVGPGIEAGVAVWDRRIELTAGSRLALVASRTDASATGGDRTSHVSPSPQAGVAFTPFPDRAWSVTTFANIGAAERLPGFFELYGDRGASVGNPDLRPERRVGYDVGLAAAAENDVLRGAITWSFFDRRIDDLILFVQTGLGVATAQNIASAAMRGHEVALSGSWRDHLGLSATWSLIDAVDTTPDRSGFRLPGRAVHTAHVQARAGVGIASLVWDVDASGTFFLDQREQRPMPARVEHDLTLAFAPHVAWEPVAALSVHNVGDVRVEQVELPDGGSSVMVPRAIADFVGQPLPGRAWFVTLSLHPARRATPSP